MAVLSPLKITWSQDLAAKTPPDSYLPEMKKFIILSLVSTSLFASEYTIYGEDNRKDPFEVTNPLYLELAKSTAAMIHKDDLQYLGLKILLSGPSYGWVHGLCENERFYNQPEVAMCSGFLVKENVIVTAGHCIKSSEDCADYKWVFNYKVTKASDRSVTIDAQDIYGCKNVIATKYEPNNNFDYAVIEIDRNVKGAKPLVLSEDRVEEDDELVMIGHPAGLPQKITDSGRVTWAYQRYFVTDLDAFGGNSGSAVFNAESGEVVGILVSGDKDFIVPETNGVCSTLNVLPDGQGRERVSKIWQIREFISESF